MKASIKKILSIILPLILGVFLVYYSFSQLDPEEYNKAKINIANANYFYLIICSIFSIGSLASRAYRWKFSLEHMGYKSYFLNNFMAVSVGYLMNLTVPRSGEVSRALVLKNYDNIPFDKSFGSIIAERVLDLIILLTFIAVAIILQFDVLKDFVYERIPVEKIFYILLILLLLGCIGFYLLFFTNLKPMVFIRDKFKGIIEGVSSIFKMKKRVPFIFHTLLIWACFVGTFYFGMKTVEATSSLSLGIIITSFVVGSLAVTFTNGGIGAFPVMISKILLLYGISEASGTAVGWILWGSQTATVVILGGISFIFLPIFNKTFKKV